MDEPCSVSQGLRDLVDDCAFTVDYLSFGRQDDVGGIAGKSTNFDSDESSKQQQLMKEAAWRVCSRRQVALKQ